MSIVTGGHVVNDSYLGNFRGLPNFRVSQGLSQSLGAYFPVSFALPDFLRVSKALLN
jgi:hypothetical protein